MVWRRPDLRLKEGSKGCGGLAQARCIRGGAVQARWLCKVQGRLWRFWGGLGGLAQGGNHSGSGGLVQAGVRFKERSGGSGWFGAGHAKLESKVPEV